MCAREGRRWEGKGMRVRGEGGGGGEEREERKGVEGRCVCLRKR